MTVVSKQLPAAPMSNSRRITRPRLKALPPDLDELIEAAAGRRLILFVGGGVSQNLELPDFQTLVQRIAGELGLSRKAIPVTEYPVLAEAYLLKHGHLGALRSWMDTTWHPPHIDITRSQMHNLIVDLNFATIYTTNYDRWLEIAFEKRGQPYQKIANMADLAANPSDRPEIIKFHGDFEEDDSLVLTEASYFQRMIFETPLDIRLRSDSLARPLLFIGYSLHDINTRYLLYRLQELWKSSAHADQRPISYIVMNERNPAQEIVLRSRGVRPIVLESREPGPITTEFMSHLLRAVEARRLEMGSKRHSRRSRKATASRA
jgi:hypothetical protein